MSLYNGNLTDRGVAVGLKRLQVAFPKQKAEFFNLLAERLADNGFTDERLTDAVNSVIDNFQYKELNISDIVKYDRRIRLYTYDEVVQKVFKEGGTTSDYPIFKDINGTKYRAYKGDIDRLTEFN